MQEFVKKLNCNRNSLINFVNRVKNYKKDNEVDPNLKTELKNLLKQRNDIESKLSVDGVKDNGLLKNLDLIEKEITSKLLEFSYDELDVFLKSLENFSDLDELRSRVMKAFIENITTGKIGREIFYNNITGQWYNNEEQAKEAARFLKDQVTVRDLNMGITQEGSIPKGSQQAQRTTQEGSIPKGSQQAQRTTQGGSIPKGSQQAQRTTQGGSIPKGSQQAQETTQGDQDQKGSPQGDRTKGTEQNQQSNTQNEHEFDPNIKKELNDKFENIRALFQSVMEEKIELDEFEKRKSDFKEKLEELENYIKQNQIPDDETELIENTIFFYKVMIKEKEEIETQINVARENMREVQRILSIIKYEKGETEEEKVRNWFRANKDCSVDEYVKKLMEDCEKAKDLYYGENRKYLTTKAINDIYMSIPAIKNLADKIKNAHTKKIILENGIVVDDLSGNIRNVKYSKRKMNRIIKGKDNIIELVDTLYKLKGGAITEDFEKTLYSIKDRLNPYILKAMQESNKFTEEDVVSYIKAIKNNQPPKNFKIIYDQEKYNKKRSVGDIIKSFFGIGLTEKEADWMNEFALKDSENKIATIGMPRNLPAKTSISHNFKELMKLAFNEIVKEDAWTVKEDKKKKKQKETRYIEDKAQETK